MCRQRWLADWAVVCWAAGSILLCTGFFAIHAAAAGALNRRVTLGRGRANSLYVLFYYLGGFAGTSMSGYAFMEAGWTGVVMLGSCILIIPLFLGIMEMAKRRS